MRRAGVLPVSIPVGEIYTALQTGTIDATEWVGPYNDMAAGLHEAAEYYYYPGWQEPSGALECLVSMEAYNSLSEELKVIVRTACIAENDYILSEFNARNQRALKTLIEEHGVQLRRFPDAVLEVLRGFSAEVLENLAAEDPMSSKVYESYKAFATESGSWLRITEGLITNIRGTP